MKILGLLLTIGMVITFVRLMLSIRVMKSIQKDFNVLIKAKGEPFRNKVTGVERMRQQHKLINSEESSRLLTAAEKELPTFIWRFRQFLIFMVLLTVALVFLKQ